VATICFANGKCERIVYLGAFAPASFSAALAGQAMLRQSVVS
jgi:hypothetical protein